MTTHLIRWESWALTEEADRRFRRIVGIVALPAAILVIILSLVHIALPPRPTPVFNPNRYVELLAQEIPKPPPEQPKPQEKPTERPQAKPQQQPKPVPQPKPTPSAREIAEKTAEFKAIEELAHLQPQDANSLNTGPLVSPTIGSAGGIGASGENIASTAARTSGGIGYAGNVTQGEGSVGLGTRRTATVRSSIDTNRSRDSYAGPAGRSVKEIEEVFDRNQGALNGIYTRAERDNPSMSDGKIVISITIAPGGEVTRCALVYSSFNAPDFEDKILERIKLMRFIAKNVPVYTYPSYTLTFQPS